MTKVRPHIEVLKALDDCQVALAITGDQRAFELLYKRWHPKLLRLAMRMTQNKDDAQDVMQDAAITIAKNIGHLKDPSKFSAWAYTIVRRRAADHIARVVKAREIKVRAVQSEIIQKSNQADETLDMKQAFERLSQPDRLANALYVDGITAKNICGCMGSPRNRKIAPL